MTVFRYSVVSTFYNVKDRKKNNLDVTVMFDAFIIYPCLVKKRANSLRHKKGLDDMNKVNSDIPAS